jgi:hypothetical protein
VTSASGTVTRPDGEVAACDKPQYIYSLCEQGPRVASRINNEGTRWVLLCRKSIGGLDSDQYNDIAMIGHNPFTGKACYFQNALYQKKDGGKVPHPADRERSSNLWAGVHGGVGSGIQCSKCHDADVWIHTPWIDGAKNPNGTSVIPKMGEDPDYPIGANDMPYAIVNRRGQGWTQIESIVDARANKCLECHRMGKGGEWTGGWLARLEQTDASWENIVTTHGKKFENAKWMPPDLNVAGVDEASWATSEYQAAIDFLQTCSRTSTSCMSVPMPEGVGGVEGNGTLRDNITLSDTTLASRSWELLEGRGCKSCHALSTNTMRRWETETKEAEDGGGCLSNIGGGEPKVVNESKTLSADETETYGPFEVAIGGTFKAQITGSGDADLYVKKHEQVSSSSYDCRPFSSTSRETCGKDQFKAHGPGRFYVMIRGKANSSRVDLKVEYTTKGSDQASPMEVVTCLKKDPSEAISPFAPEKLGTFTTGAHLGWFADLFRGAYPVGDDGNTRNTWVVEFTKFKQLMTMPKGNHPKLSQAEYSTLVEWFMRGLPLLSNYVQDGGQPTTCSPSITTDMTSHISSMATQGWKAVNQSRGMNMYNVSGAPRAGSKPYGSGWEVGGAGTIKILREFGNATSYWMRSSPDGRFVGNGGVTDAGAVVTDLQRGVDIPAHASYDPGFFPDNSGFIIQSGGFCSNNLLVSNPTEITFEEAQCTAAGSVGLYQHLASGLGGGDHFVINSQFTSDPAGSGSDNPTADFVADAEIQITPMAFDGTKYTQKSQVTVTSPFKGDSVLSPSSRLVISRLAGPGGTQLGFAIDRITLTPSGTTYDISLDEIATYCVAPASKPSISFDEKWAVYHRYEGDKANLYLLNLTNGTETKITNMSAGQQAVFPHFRSDGLIYFLVKKTSGGLASGVEEAAAVTDAATVL